MSTPTVREIPSRRREVPPVRVPRPSLIGSDRHPRVLVLVPTYIRSN